MLAMRILSCQVGQTALLFWQQCAPAHLLEVAEIMYLQLYQNLDLSQLHHLQHLQIARRQMKMKVDSIRNQMYMHSQ